MVVTIYYLSDLHLEYIKPNISKSELVSILPTGDTSSDLLILAGDIGSPFGFNLKPFLTLAKARFAEVIYVPGNHEFWNIYVKPSVTDICLRELCNLLGVIYLNRNSAVVNDRIHIMGTTLWSDIPPDMDDVMSDYLYDNRKIKDWSPSRAREEFFTNYRWLEETLSTIPSDRTIIVVTHHAPLLEGTAKSIYQGDPKNCGYSSDCSKLVDRADYWIFGHTHYSVNFKHNKCRVLANQLGKLEELNTGFKVNSHFHC